MSGKPRVVLLNPPGREMHIRDLYCSITSKGDYYWPPIDLLVASARLKEKCELSVVDATVSRLSAAETLELVAGRKPSVVLSLTGSSSWVEDMRLLHEIKRRTGCRVVVTGDVCLDPELWLLKEFPWLDALLTDFTSSSLLPFVLGGSLEGGDGLAYRDGDALRELPRSPAREFSIPVPPHELFPLAKYSLPYARHYPFSTVLTNFGCPFTCGYCIQNREVMGSRRRPPENVIEELSHLHSLGIREVYFRDPMFEAHRPNALALCREMKKRGFAFSWSCNCRVDTVTEEMIEAMASAGCRLVAFGFETASEEILKKYGKGSLEQARAAIALCHKHGIKVAGYWILGLPGESFEDVLKTIRFASENGSDFASFSLPSPDYGTDLREESIGRGIISGSFRKFDRSRVEKSLNAELSEEQLKTLHRAALRAFYMRPAYWVKTAGMVRSARQLKEMAASAWRVLKAAFL